MAGIFHLSDVDSTATAAADCALSRFDCPAVGLGTGRATGAGAWRTERSCPGTLTTVGGSSALADAVGCDPSEGPDGAALTGEGSTAAFRGAPHDLQNLLVAGLPVPQFLQASEVSSFTGSSVGTAIAGVTLTPHDLQNFTFGGFSALQLAHVTLVCMGLTVQGKVRPHAPQNRSLAVTFSPQPGHFES